jgi:predicted permease
MGWSRFLHRAKSDRERHAEIESYVEIETDANVARGMPLDQAHCAARKKFGNPTLIREDIYRMNTIGFLDTLARNVRYALRALRHNPTFTVIAVLTLGIGIGANTAVFSVVNSVLLKPLPYPKSEELVAVRQIAPGAAGLTSFTDGLLMSGSMYFTYAEQNRTFQAMGMWTDAAATVTGLAEPEQVRTVVVSDGVLQAFEVQPALGRWLTKADQVPGGPQTVMLGYGYWQRRFGGDRSVIGRTITVNANLREIVGVMPQGFRVVTADPDLIAPFAIDRSQLILPGFGLQGVARLKPGVTIAEADADIARMVPIWMSSWPAAPGVNPRTYENWRIAPDVRPLKQDVVGPIDKVLWVVMGTIGIVLLIACANVANLLLVRAEERQQELAVRAALGAGWGRIVREMLLESVLLGLLGGLLGLGIAYAGVRLLVAYGPATLPRLEEISVDPRALSFNLVASLLSGLLFGLIPALKYAGPRVSFALRSGGRTSSQSRERHRTRNILVVAQVALALVLLVSSGLMIRTFQSLRAIDPGFTDAAHLQTMRIGIPPTLITEPERVARLQNDILDKLSAIPGVASAAFASNMPMEEFGTAWDGIFPEGQEYKGGVFPPMRVFKFVSPGLFQTAGTKVIAGRDYTWKDLYGGRRVTVLSENLARELWGEPSAAVGKRIRTGLPGASLWEVVGVVQDVRNSGADQPAPAIVYWPSFTAEPSGSALQIPRTGTFVIRSDRAGTQNFINQVQQAVWSVNSNLAPAYVRTMQDVYDRSPSVVRTSFTLVMLAIAGAMALVLGIIGIYGVLSYAVSQRRREIGIRLALGAQPVELKTMFVRHGLTLAAIGVAIGLAAAAGLTRLMSSLLFGIQALDPLTYAAGALLLGLAAALASYLPARRAAIVDPVEALKAE